MNDNTVTLVVIFPDVRKAEQIIYQVVEGNNITVFTNYSEARKEFEQRLEEHEVF